LNIYGDEKFIKDTQEGSKYFEIMNLYREVIENEAKLAVSITDIYTTFRILVHDDFINSIIYFGDSHRKNIHKYLIEIGFTLYKKMEATSENERCIKDIIPFTNFFSKDFSELESKLDGGNYKYKYLKYKSKYLSSKKLLDIS